MQKEEGKKTQTRQKAHTAMNLIHKEKKNDIVGKYWKELLGSGKL